jgi:hypothetical protein
LELGHVKRFRAAIKTSSIHWSFFNFRRTLMNEFFQDSTYVSMGLTSAYVVLSGPGIGSEVYRKVDRFRDKDVGQTVLGEEVSTEPIIEDDYQA